MRSGAHQQGNLGPASLLLACLLGTWWLYQPGLSGTFLFDDWKNLATLGEQGTIESGTEAVTYLLSGFAGPTGRPVSLASFLIDSNTWPAPAASFKRTNLLIHLLNGALLTALLFQLASSLTTRRDQAAWIALLGASFWVLHPLFVSTTLYVVQRMTMLAATFVLMGLITYIHGYRLLKQKQIGQGYTWMTVGVVCFTILATLSKENGALLPLFIIVIDALILSRCNDGLRSVPTSFRIWRWIFLFIPIIALLGYMATTLPALLSGDSLGRDFTPWQRLLTESRILVSYLGTLWLPQPYTGGLFNDGITVSTGLNTPGTTLLSLVTLIVLAIIATALRRRAPTVAVAITFFFAGHLLESTFIPLELYFEHRNYLPAMLMGFPLSWYLVMATRTQFRVRMSVALAIVILLAAETGMRAYTWGRPFTQALVWAKQNPESPRAQNHLASLWQETGNTQEATRLLTHALLLDPDNLLTKLNLTLTKCRTSKLTNTDIRWLRKAMYAAGAQSPVQRYQLKTTIERLREYSCGEWSTETYMELLHDTIQQTELPQSSAWRQTLLQLYGQAALERQLPNEAYQSFLAALQEKPSWQGILKNSALLASAGYPHLALSLMNVAPRPAQIDEKEYNIKALRNAWLDYTGYYIQELAHLRNVITQDI